MSEREAFVERFGEDTAAKIEAAAAEHKKGIHDKPGSDPFRWALLICIGYDCMSKDGYREHHGIAAPWADLNEWMLARPEWFAEHDGDVDYVTLVCGTYNEYVGREAVT